MESRTFGNELKDALKRPLSGYPDDDVVVMIAVTRNGKEIFLAHEDFAHEVRDEFPPDEIRHLVDVFLKKMFIDRDGRRWCCFLNKYWPC